MKIFVSLTTAEADGTMKIDPVEFIATTGMIFFLQVNISHALKAGLNFLPHEPCPDGSVMSMSDS